MSPVFGASRAGAAGDEPRDELVVGVRRRRDSRCLTRRFSAAIFCAIASLGGTASSVTPHPFERALAGSPSIGRRREKCARRGRRHVARRRKAVDARRRGYPIADRSALGGARMAGEKAFPVSWEEFHRDARALAWRLAGQPGRSRRSSASRAAGWCRRRSSRASLRSASSRRSASPPITTTRTRATRRS